MIDLKDVRFPSSFGSSAGLHAASSNSYNQDSAVMSKSWELKNLKTFSNFNLDGARPLPKLPELQETSEPDDTDCDPQFRSSRSNRHLQHENTPRGRVGGVIDHDPTEGLPVKKWARTEVTVKQVERDDEDDSKAGAANDNNTIWRELPLPKDFHLLPPHSQVSNDLPTLCKFPIPNIPTQELLRRARQINKNPTISVFNPKTGLYTRPLEPSSGNKLATATSPAADPDIEMNDDDLDNAKPTADEDRTFLVRRWAPLPAAIADRKAEPKFLADRRPGLPPLYGQGANMTVAYNAQQYGAATTQTNGEMAGLDLGDGNGLGSAITSAAPPEPQRKRPPPPPPKRKKKGPFGRRKKVHTEAPTSAPAVSAPMATDGGFEAVMAAQAPKLEDGTAEPTQDGEHKDDEDDDGSGSDEGSEEGEIDEGDDTAAAKLEEAELEVQKQILPSAPEPMVTAEEHGEIVAATAEPASEEVPLEEVEVQPLDTAPTAESALPLAMVEALPTDPDPAAPVLQEEEPEVVPNTIAGAGADLVPQMPEQQPETIGGLFPDGEEDLLGSLERGMEEEEAAAAAAKKEAVMEVPVEEMEEVKIPGLGREVEGEGGEAMGQE